MKTSFIAALIGTLASANRYHGTSGIDWSTYYGGGNNNSYGRTPSRRSQYDDYAPVEHDYEQYYGGGYDSYGYGGRSSRRSSQYDEYAPIDPYEDYYGNEYSHADGSCGEPSITYELELVNPYEQGGYLGYTMPFDLFAPKAVETYPQYTPSRYRPNPYTRTAKSRRQHAIGRHA